MEKLLKIYVEENEDSWKWYDLYNEQDYSTLKEKILNDEELDIINHETDFDENMNMYSLKDLIYITDQTCSMSDYEYGHLMSYHEVTGCDMLSAIQEYENSDYYHGKAMEDIVHEYIQGLYGNKDIISLNYFDYNSFARVLNHDGYTETNSGVVRIYKSGNNMEKLYMGVKL